MLIEKSIAEVTSSYSNRNSRLLSKRPFVPIQIP